MSQKFGLARICAGYSMFSLLTDRTLTPLVFLFINTVKLKLNTILLKIVLTFLTKSAVLKIVRFKNCVTLCSSKIVP